MNKFEQEKEEIKKLQEQLTQAQQKLEQARVKAKYSLEDEYRELVQTHKFKITDLVKEAKDKLKQAEQLSEEYGIPFNSTVVDMDNKFPYIPKSLNKFDELDFSDIKDISGLDDNYLDRYFKPFINYGWCWNSSSLSC